MRTTIIRSTNVVESGIRQIRDAKAGVDCLCALSVHGAQQFLARLHQSLNALVAWMSGYPAPSTAHATSGGPSSPAGMLPWFGMTSVFGMTVLGLTPVAVALPKAAKPVVAKRATPSERERMS